MTERTVEVGDVVFLFVRAVGSSTDVRVHYADVRLVFTDGTCLVKTKGSINKWRVNSADTYPAEQICNDTGGPVRIKPIIVVGDTQEGLPPLPAESLADKWARIEDQLRDAKKSVFNLEAGLPFGYIEAAGTNFRDIHALNILDAYSEVTGGGSLLQRSNRLDGALMFGVREEQLEKLREWEIAELQHCGVFLYAGRLYLRI